MLSQQGELAGHSVRRPRPASDARRRDMEESSARSLSVAYREPRRKRYADCGAPPTVWGHRRRGAGAISLVSGNKETTTPIGTIGDTKKLIPVFAKLQLFEGCTTSTTFDRICKKYVFGRRCRAVVRFQSCVDGALGLLPGGCCHAGCEVHSAFAEVAVDGGDPVRPGVRVGFVAGRRSRAG